MRHVPGLHLGIHAHDDTGHAVANSLAAVRAGVRQIQGTLNGLGERCGNANLTSILPTLVLKMGFKTGADEDRMTLLTQTARLVDERLNRSPNRHAAYVGESAFAHKGGLHVAAIEKDPTTYEHVPPESVGNTRRILVSDQAGRANVLSRLRALGIAPPSDPAKIAALVELVKQKYPKDTLDIVVFGNDAWPIELKEVPYLQVGPFHTNTVAGLELAMDILKRRRNANKQIFMITDGKPTCLKIGKNYYKNSFGLDRKIVNRCLNLAMQCKKLNIPITTFMIARDPYLVRFVEAFTQTNNGKAFYSSLQGLGSFVLENYKKRKRK
jgi:hypothetical protein